MSVSAEKQTHLSGHKWHISQLEFSPGGLHLASASWDKAVRIWDLSTLESVFVLRHHRNPVTCLSWQPGVTAAGCLGILASGSADSTVALWNADTGKLLHSFSHHKGWVLGTSFSSGDNLLASAGWDKTVCLSDARTGQLVQRLVGHSTGVWTCAFHTTGISTNLLCSGADDGSLKIWDTRMAAAVTSLVGAHDDSVKSCAWSPDGGYIASGAADNKIALWEPRSGTLLIKLRAHEDAVNEVQFYPVISSKSVPIIFSVGDNSCRVWHPLRKRSKQLLMIKQHRSGFEVEALALSPDGTLLATAARDRDIILSSLDVSLKQVDALPIEDEKEATSNYGATLWKKYTKKVMQRILNEASDSDSSQRASNYKNTAFLVGRAVYKTEIKTKENGILKEAPHIEVNGNTQSDGILKDQRARLRKSSWSDSTGAQTNGFDHEGGLHKVPRPGSTGYEDHGSTNEVDQVRQHLRHVDLNNGHVNDHDMDMNGNNYSGFVENGGIDPKKSGYQSHNDSSSVSSSSYYGDIEDVAKEMYDLADGVEDCRL